MADSQTKRLNEQVRRNLEHFPGDFMFRLTNQEVAILRSQFVTASSEARRWAWGGRRTAPYAFTEHGAMMVATVLNSPRAIEVSAHVVRAFVRLREMIAIRKELAKTLQGVSSATIFERPLVGVQRRSQRSTSLEHHRQ